MSFKTWTTTQKEKMITIWKNPKVRLACEIIVIALTFIIGLIVCLVMMFKA